MIINDHFKLLFLFNLNMRIHLCLLYIYVHFRKCWNFNMYRILGKNGPHGLTHVIFYLIYTYTYINSKPDMYIE